MILVTGGAGFSADVTRYRALVFTETRRGKLS